MSDSLQDQLRALGLAKDEPDRHPKQPRRKTRKGKNAARPPATGSFPEPSLDEAYALREREERRDAARQRQARLEEERRRREINGRIRAVVEDFGLGRDGAELPRNFLFKGRIRKIYVTLEQQQALTVGAMGIVYLAGGYHLLAAEPLEQVRRISPEHVVDLRDAGDDEDEHPVPDDLVW